MGKLHSGVNLYLMCTMFICFFAFAAFSGELSNEKLTKNQIKAAQSALNELGFDAGAVDGALGKKTRNAYQLFAQKNEVEYDGLFSENEVATVRAYHHNLISDKRLTKVELPTGPWPMDLMKPKVMEQRKVLSRGYLGRVLDDRGKLWTENCENIISNSNEVSHRIAEGNYDDKGGPLGVHGCLEGLGNIVSYKNDFSTIASVLSSISTREYQKYYEKDFNGFYDALSVVTILATHYAVFYNEYNLSDDVRYRVDSFLRRNLQIDIDKSRSLFAVDRVVPCLSENFDLFGYDDRHNNPWIDNNTCGSLRWKLANAQLALALRLKNKELFEMAKYNSQKMLDLFDDQNIFVTWAATSGWTVGYSKDTPNMLALQSELYESIGFDYLTARGENGSTVSDYFATYWDLWDDDLKLRDTALYKYAKRPKRAHERDVNEIENKSMRQLLRENDTHAATLARWMKRYAQRFNNEILTHDEPNQFRDGIFGHPNNIISSFNIVDVELLRLANED